jgi:hypothetical protein
VGGELPGSPLPLNPYSAGLDATDLPGLGDLVPATVAPDAGSPAQPTIDAELADGEPAEADAAGGEPASDGGTTRNGAGAAPVETSGTAVADEVVARG